MTTVPTERMGRGVDGVPVRFRVRFSWRLKSSHVTDTVWPAA